MRARPRLRLPAPPSAERQTPIVITSPGRVAPVGAPSSRRAPIVSTASLPADHRANLSTIAKALRNVPRDCIHDPAELFHWLNRQAKALERARDTPMPMVPSIPRPAVPAPALSSPPRAISARERAEAVFERSPPPSSGMTPAQASPPTSAEAMFRTSGGTLPRPRIVMDRKGYGVRVEVRRARAAGQLEMPI